MLSEVEQTVDDVVIIANGRRVAQGTVEELRGEPTAYVRTSDPDRLSQALRDRGLTVTPSGRGLRVTTEDLAVVGDVAHASDVAIHELRTEQTHLEELFFNPTESEEHRNRNLGDMGAPAPSGAPADLPPPSGPPIDPALLVEPTPAGPGDDHEGGIR